MKMNAKQILTTVYLFGFINTLVIKNLEIDSTTLELKTKIKIIINSLLIESLYFLVIDTDELSKDEITSDIFQHIHSDNPVPVISLQDYFIDNEAFKRNDNIENSVGFIFIISQTGGECFVKSNWTDSPFWNPRAFFLLVITTTVTEETDKMADMLRDCWENFNILNLVVIFQYKVSLNINDMNVSTNYSTVIRIISFNPFVPTGNIINISNKKLNVSSKIFPNKLSDTHGYKIPATTRSMSVYIKKSWDTEGREHVTGLDRDIFDILLDKLNASLVYKPYENTDFKFNPHNYIVLNSEPLRKSMFIQMSYPHYDICFTLITPKAQEIPRYMNIFLIFTKDLWLLYFLTVVCIAGIWKSLSNNDILENKQEYLKDKFYETLSIMILGSTECKPSFFPQRLILITGLILNIVINNSYQGCLTSYLSTTKYLPDFKTFVEAGYSGLPISVFLSVNELAELRENIDLNDDLSKQLFSKLIVKEDEDAALDWIAYHRNMTRISYKTPARAVAKLLKYYKDDSPLLHVVDDCYASSYAAMNMGDRNSPFMSIFSTILQRLWERGIINKLRNDFVTGSPRTSVITKPVPRPKVLTLDHLQSPFYILFIGCCLSIIVFILEKYLNKSSGKF